MEMISEIEVADKLGYQLLRNGVIDKDTLDRALKIKGAEDPAKRRSLAQILVDEFNLNHETVFSEVKNLYGFREIDLSQEKIDDKRLEFIRKMFEPLPDSLQQKMREEKIIVLKYDNKQPYKYIFVSADPTHKLIPTIARVMGAKRYEIYYAKFRSIRDLLEKAFPIENQFLKEFEDGSIEIGEIEDESLDEEAIDAEINKSMLVNLVEGMLIEAVRQGVSDIHIVPKNPTTTDVHFRIDGKLQIWHTQEGVRPEAISAVLKDRSKNIDRFERERAQDGFIQRKIDGYMIRYRVSVMPIVGSEFQFKYESIVIRILDDRKVITDLNMLGFEGYTGEVFVKAISQPQGMIIVTGPTGSGKSTTLMAALHHIIRPDINVLTVEDPVEYIIKGARQLKIGPKMGFELAIRSILRHDPDVVMVGEIRDKITGETAIKLANTGHLTFSTLHTNDAPSAVSRLYKMGIETFLIAYAINIIIAQRLIRRVCENCKEPIKNIDPAVPLKLGFSEEEVKKTTFFKAVGCDKCHGGYKGRAAIHECLYFSKDIRKLIFSTGSDINEESIREKAISEGMLTLRAAARERVKNGISTLEELVKTTSEG